MDLAPNALLASIPSPPSNVIEIGPLALRAYGLAIALGVLAAVNIAQRRWAARGGDPGDIGAIGTGGVIAGLIGARLYHVITDWPRFEGRWLDAFAIWKGGLGIPGGLVAGVLVGTYIARRRGLPVPTMMDMTAPAIPVAQAIGRLGNWFNQELFGRPTDLPWGLEIDLEHRPVTHLDQATYHPTFLYEALWNLTLAAVLVFVVERRWPKARPGRLFALYVLGYAVGRFLVESLRIDPASQVLGLRVNLWVSLLVGGAALVWLATFGRRPASATAPATAGAVTGDRAASADSGAGAKPTAKDEDADG